MNRTPFCYCFGLAVCLLAAGGFNGATPALAQRVAPAFKQLVVSFQPDGLSPFGQTEELKIESSGDCWYTATAVEGRLNSPERVGAVFKHGLSEARIERLNRLLEATAWLTADGAEGRATHTHPTTVTIQLQRDDGDQTVTCRGQRPEPYAALLHELHGLALQERRVYLHDYVGGEDGALAWDEIGRELAAARGEPYQASPFSIEYSRYLSIAQRIERQFYGRSDEELIPALRLIGHLRAEPELKYLHRLAHDRDLHVRREVAWALSRIHNDDSLPVLAGMMAQGGDTDVGFELVQWGDAAVPHIITLIAQSTDDRLETWERTSGEWMIRTYLDRGSELDKPVDARVVSAVREALAKKDPANGLIRTQYHEAFLEQVAAAGAKAKQP